MQTTQLAQTDSITLCFRKVFPGMGAERSYSVCYVNFSADAEGQTDEEKVAWSSACFHVTWPEKGPWPKLPSKIFLHENSLCFSKGESESRLKPQWSHASQCCSTISAPSGCPCCCDNKSVKKLQAQTTGKSKTAFVVLS